MQRSGSWMKLAIVSRERIGSLQVVQEDGV